MNERKLSKQVTYCLISVIFCFPLFGCIAEANNIEGISRTPLEVLSTTVEADTTSETKEKSETSTTSSQTINLDEIPGYSGSPYVTVNDNVPFFTDDDLTLDNHKSRTTLEASKPAS